MPDDMAHVEYAFPVDKIHGKVSKKHTVGFAHMTASQLNYTRTYGKRTTPLTQKEKDHRAKFAAVAAATHERMMDTEQIVTDQENFKKQTKYMSLYRYIWNLEWEAYEG